MDKFYGGFCPVVYADSLTAVSAPIRFADHHPCCRFRAVWRSAALDALLLTRSVGQRMLDRPAPSPLENARVPRLPPN